MDSDEAAGQQAMTAERLAVIRAMIALTDVGDAQFEAVTELLAEVERLRAELAVSERVSEMQDKYLQYLSVENAQLRAQIAGTVASAGDGKQGDA